MKAYILSLLFIITINAQNVWYVNRDAIGQNTGRSWTDAWNYLDSTGANPNGINWAVIGDGDSIYISGGLDSTLYTTPTGIYSHQIYPSYSVYGLNGIKFNEEVVIAPAWQTNHNGDVYFGARDENCGWILEIHNISNIKLTGFNIVDTRTIEGSILYLGGEGVDGRYYKDSMITIDNWNITGNGRASMIYLSGNAIKITNCYIQQPENDLPNDQDPFGISGGKGNHIIDNNTIIVRNGAVTDAHRDVIQLSNLGREGETMPRSKITISNNLIVDTNPNGTHWNNMIYNYGWSYTPPIEFLVYNNIIVSQKINTNPGGISIGRLDGTHLNTIKILNNTIILKGSQPTGGTPITNWEADTLIIKNNLIVQDTLIINFINAANGYNFYDINHNYYAEVDGIDAGENFATRGPAYTWTQWKAIGYDTNSFVDVSLNVNFSNKYGLEKSDYYTTTGKDAGENLWDEYPFLRYDVLGNERPQIGDWNIGALEYTGSQSNNVRVRGKIYLQGPFNTNLMLTNLTQGSFLPNSQPYNQPPWNYNGNESFSAGPNSTMVDWVLVELRSATNPSQVVGRRAAVLKNNGILLEPNGSEGVLFTNVDPGSYYITIHHRNHLAIMSANPVPLSSNSNLYDFTTAMNKAYGQNPMVELGTGKYGMYATDGNADGVVNTSDRDNVWLIQNGNMGYLSGDFNMNSGVTVHDVNQLWNMNNGKISQVP